MLEISISVTDFLVQCSRAGREPTEP
jgi:hypothetical protein